MTRDFTVTQRRPDLGDDFLEVALVFLAVLEAITVWGPDRRLVEREGFFDSHGGAPVRG